MYKNLCFCLEFPLYNKLNKIKQGANIWKKIKSANKSNKSMKYQLRLLLIITAIIPIILIEAVNINYLRKNIETKSSLIMANEARQ